MISIRSDGTAPLGFATCLLAASGLLIYLARQRDADARSTRFVRLMTVALVGGLPLGTAGASLAWVGACAVEAHPDTPMTVAFALAAGVAAIVGGVTGLRDALMLTWLAAGFGFVALPFVAPVVTGLGLTEVWADRAMRGTLVVDAVFWMVGAVLVAAAVVIARSRSGQAVLPAGVRSEWLEAEAARDSIVGPTPASKAPTEVI